MVQALCAASIGRISRQRVIMLLGGLHELTEVTFRDGACIDDITEEAVDASLALLTPPT